MTVKEKAVKVIADYLQETIKEDYNDWGIESWGEMLRAFGLDSEDMKEEINSVLTDNKLMFTDEYELETEDGFVTYRQLVTSIKKELKKRNVFKQATEDYE